MNPELKQKWVAALRSGKYQQGIGFLKQISTEGPKYCCLGVLCDLVDEAVEVEKREVLNDAHEGQIIAAQFRIEGKLCAKELPYEFQRKIGLPPPYPDLMRESFAASLIHLNDRYHKNFNQIADYIEREI